MMILTRNHQGSFRQTSETIKVQRPHEVLSVSIVTQMYRSVKVSGMRMRKTSTADTKMTSASYLMIIKITQVRSH